MINLKQNFIALAFIIILSNASVACADTIYLKNGRQMNGLITQETDGFIELDFSFGTIKLKRDLIKKIDRSSPEVSAYIKEQWEKDSKIAAQQKADEETELSEKDLKEDIQDVEMSKEDFDNSQRADRDNQKKDIIVNALINGTVSVRLLFKPDVSDVILFKYVMVKLGGSFKNMDRFKKVEFYSDNKIIEGRKITLKSIEAGGVKARNVSAVAYMGDADEAAFDGIMGISFLKHFKFHIDKGTKELILENK